MSLKWQVQTPVAEDMVALLDLADEKGRSVASVSKLVVDSAHRYTSKWPAGEEHADFYLLPVVASTPPGNYTLKAILHPAGDGSRLSVLDAEGRPQGAEVVLATVRVERQASVEGQEPDALIHSFGELALTEVEVLDSVVDPGAELWLRLFWWAAEKPSDDYRVRVALKDEAGNQVYVTRGRSVYDSFPTSEWRKGELVAENRLLRVPARLTGGTYTVSIGLERAHGGLVGAVDAGVVKVNDVERTYAGLTPTVERYAVFSDLFELLGYEVTTGGETGAGGSVELKLWWRSLRETDTSYTVFTHLLGPGEVVWGQQDSLPVGGSRPTPGWVTNEVIEDIYSLTLRETAPSGKYQLEIGWYDAQTMERLPVTEGSQEEGATRLILCELDLKP